MKAYFTFPKAAGLEPHHQMVLLHIFRTLVLVVVVGGSYLSAKIQSFTPQSTGLSAYFIIFTNPSARAGYF